MTISRALIRNEVASLLQNGVPSAQEVVNYQTAPAGRSPFISVLSAGSLRKPWQPLGSKAYLGIHVYVLHADPDSNWTEEDAEDMIDQVEMEIVDVIVANQTGPYWSGIESEVPSIIDRTIIDGVPYLHEIIPLEFEVKK